jgi:hypothetical protein
MGRTSGMVHKFRNHVLTAYSDEIVHPIRFNPSTRSDLVRPLNLIHSVYKKSSAALATTSYGTGRHPSSRAHFPLRFTDQIEAVSVMHEAIQDRIRQGWMREARVIFRYGDLGRDQGGGPAKAIVQDLEQVLGLGQRDGIPHLIVEDEQVDASQTGQQVGVGGLQMSTGRLLEQARRAEVTDGETFSVRKTTLLLSALLGRLIFSQNVLK